MSTAITVPLSLHKPNEFGERVEEACGGPLRARSIETIQVNIGLTCDLACRHCHVESSPKRTEQMDWRTILLVLHAASRAGVKTLDITGGAPEMNPNFRRFVKIARCRDLDVLVRTNLTIMLKDGHGDLPEFYRDNGVHLIASLPCYLPQNVKQQRGAHVYEDSVAVIRRLNAVGYGWREDLPLDLVYNPIGPALPPDQATLESTYRKELKSRFGLRFTRLIAITNMPIGRFLHDLRRDGVMPFPILVLRPPAPARHHPLGVHERQQAHHTAHPPLPPFGRLDRGSAEEPTPTAIAQHNQVLRRWGSGGLFVVGRKVVLEASLEPGQVRDVAVETAEVIQTVPEEIGAHEIEGGNEAVAHGARPRRPDGEVGVNGGIAVGVPVAVYDPRVGRGARNQS